MTLAGCIDHTLLRAEATAAEVWAVAAEAVAHRFAAVCVHGRFVAEVARVLRGSGVRTCGVAGFPLGAGRATAKTIEATMLVEDGADEVDFVAHLPPLLERDRAASEAEFGELVRAVRSANPAVVVKVIVESALLLAGVDGALGEARIADACRAARESGCDFVKTSSGFHPAGGASVEAVALVKKHAGGLGVKAAGGIRTFEQARRMLEAGADRLGCSAGVAILAEAARAGRP